MGPVDTQQGVCVTCSVFPPNPNDPATPLWCPSRRCDDGSHVFPASPSLSTYTERKCTAGGQTSCEDARRTWCNFLYGNCHRRSGSRGNTDGDLYVVANGESEETRSEEAMKKGGRTSWQRRAPWSTRAQSSSITRLHGLLLQPRGDSASPSSRGEM